MRILIVTGTLAEDYVREAVKGIDADYEIVVMPYPVAALLSIPMISRHLRRMDLSEFDLVLIPGLVRGDSSLISREVKIPVYKGPTDAWDIPEVLRLYLKGEIELSTRVPACELISEIADRRLEVALDEGVIDRGLIKIGGVSVSRGGPLRIAAEIIDAPKLSKNELVRMARYYADSGADIIDIGMVAGEDNSKKIPMMISVLRRSIDKPLSIDSVNISEIEVALREGIDLVVSIEGGSMEALSSDIRDVPVVLIPYNYAENYFPERAEDRVDYIEELLDRARRYNIKHVLCDLILNPINMPSLTESIHAFKLFSEKNPDIPIFMGVGNVTELVDADSPGINAIMAGLAMEMEVSLLLTTEASDKTKGSVSELVRASKMMYLAKMKRSVPKNLGVDLLILKDKRRGGFKYGFDSEIVVRADEKPPIRYDKKGFFRISVDHDKGEILALHYSPRSPDTPDRVIIGNDPVAIYLKIIDMDLISEPSHAAYLGMELAKAEIALRLGKRYTQDERLFET